MRAPIVVAAAAMTLAGCRGARAPEPAVVLWAWERAEDLRFAPAAEVAVQTGFVELAGDGIRARGRRFPLLADRPPTTVVVHVQIDHSRPIAWTPSLRRRLAGAVLHYATTIPAPRVQLDFEVRASERAILLDALRDLRRSLPRTTRLSMTALASWCMYEDWLADAPVDEVVPMLFRMGPGGGAIVKALAAGGDFRHPRCRAAIGVATDSPIRRAPPGRRVYLFNPRAWDRATLLDAQRMVKAWR